MTTSYRSNKSIHSLVIVLFKVREGRRGANFPELCGFLDYTAISKDI